MKNVRENEIVQKKIAWGSLQHLRLISLASQLGWNQKILNSSNQSIQISPEEQGIEFLKIVESSFPDHGLYLLQKSGILQYWIDQSIKGTSYEGQLNLFSMDQNSPYHQLTLDEHTLQVLKNSLRLHESAPHQKKVIFRLTAILHDFGKMFRGIHAKTEKGFTSYHSHEIHSAALAELFLSYLGLESYISFVKPLAKHHMRPHDLVRNPTLKSIKRFLKEIALDNVYWEDLLYQAEADATAKDKTPGPTEEVYLAQLNELRHHIRLIESKMDVVGEIAQGSEGPNS